MRFSILYITIFFFTLLGCQKEDNSIVLSGKISNYKNPYFLIYSGHFQFPDAPNIDTAYVDSEGEFTANLTQGDFHTYQIPTQKGSLSIFLKEGKNTLQFDYKDIQNTAYFGGPFKNENENILTFNKTVVSKINYPLFALDIDSFKVKLTELIEEQKSFWIEKNESLSLDNDFLNLQLAQADFTQANLLFSYPTLHQQVLMQQKKQAKLKNLIPNSDFYSIFREEGFCNNIVLFKNTPLYTQFLSSYLIQLQNRKDMLSNIYPHLTANEPVQVLDLIDAIVQDSSIKRFVLAHQIYQRNQMKGGLDNELEGLVKAFIERYPKDAEKTFIKKYLSEKEKMKRVAKGESIPSFTFEDLKGKAVSLESLKGKNLYIDVWATWCRPCLAEIPHFKKLKKEFKGKDIEFISISVDQNKNAWIKMAKENTEGLQLYAEPSIAGMFKEHFMIQGIPRFILIDKEGRVINANAPRPSSNNIRDVLNLL